MRAALKPTYGNILRSQNKIRGGVLNTMRPGQRSLKCTAEEIMTSAVTRSGCVCRKKEASAPPNEWQTKTKCSGTCNTSSAASMSPTSSGTS